MERKKSEEFVKKVYVNETEGPRRRGKPGVRWKDRVKEYMKELLIEVEGLNKQGGRGGGFSVVAITFGNVFGGNKPSEVIYTYRYNALHKENK